MTELLEFSVRRVSAYEMQDAVTYMSTAVNKLRELVAYLKVEEQK